MFFVKIPLRFMEDHNATARVKAEFLQQLRKTYSIQSWAVADEDLEKVKIEEE